MIAVSSELAFRVWAPDNLIYGPVDSATLLQWVEERRVRPETWIHWGASNDWVAAGDIEELKASFEALPPLSEEEADAGEGGEGSVTVEELRKFERFDPYSNEELQVLLDHCDVVAVGDAELVIRKGDLSDAIFLVLSGEVRARLMVGGHDTSLGSMGPGELLGEVAMLSHSARSADVVAVTSTRLLRLTSDRFQEMISGHPPLAAKILFNMARLLATRLADRNLELQRDLASSFVWR